MLKFNVASAEGASRKFLEMAQLDAANSMPGQLDAADSTPGLFSCKTVAIIRVRARVRVSIEACIESAASKRTRPKFWHSLKTILTFLAF